jgi:ribosomal protein S18 acetylase RimI-like enzyme
MTAVTVGSAFPAWRGGDAAVLVFEYMAATQAETGRRVPAGVDDLPAVLQRECRDLQGVYRPPGTLLVAECGGRLAGCVGLAALPERAAEVRRLYVRPAFRGNGIARTLMSHAHDHADRHGMTRLILDVLPARQGVIGFYRRLGYTDTGPFETESPVPMIYMERPVTGTGRRQPAAPDDATAKREADPS